MTVLLLNIGKKMAYATFFQWAESPVGQDKAATTRIATWLKKLLELPLYLNYIFSLNFNFKIFFKLSTYRFDRTLDCHL